MEQLRIRGLPTGTTAAPHARAERHHRSVEAEARAILTDALGRDPVTIVDPLSMDEGSDIEFRPGRLGRTARTPG